MIVISDTNILGSVAAGDAFLSLLKLYEKARLGIPPEVEQELRTGLDRGRTFLEPVIEAILTRRIEVIPLTAEEEFLTFSYPSNLDEGERQAIALTQTRKARLLSNDRSAIRYCEQRNIKVVSLANLLRLFWVEQLMSQDEVRGVIEKMQQVEKYKPTSKQLLRIFT